MEVIYSALVFYLTPSHITLYDQEVAHEAISWSGLHHKSIVPFLGTMRYPGYQGYFMVSPWMANGELISYLYSKDLEGVAFVRESTRLVRKITWISICAKVDAHPEQLYQIARGIEYLHQRGVVHGDIRGVRSLSTAPIRFICSNGVLIAKYPCRWRRGCSDRGFRDRYFGRDKESATWRSQGRSAIQGSRTH